MKFVVWAAVCLLVVGGCLAFLKSKRLTPEDEPGVGDIRDRTTSEREGDDG